MTRLLQAAPIVWEHPPDRSAAILLLSSMLPRDTGAMTMTGRRFEDDLTEARARDARDPLAPFRERFYRRPGVIYLDGNSLGLASYDAEAAVLAALEQWKQLAIDGW